MLLRVASVVRRGSAIRPSPWVGHVASSSAAVTPDSGQKLRDNIRVLGNLLGEVIKADNANVFDAVEKLRALGREWREPGPNSRAKFDEMVQEVKSYDAKKLHGVSRAFTHFLSLSNSAENHHRVRRLREFLVESHSSSPLSSKLDSVLGTMRDLTSTHKLTPAQIVDTLKAQSVELVFTGVWCGVVCFGCARAQTQHSLTNIPSTAHPTEVNRRTTLQKHQRIKKILEEFDRADLLEYDKRQLAKHLHVEIESIWHSDELKRKKPTPVDEARSGIAVVENVLWNALPRFLRKLDDVLEQEFGTPMPPDFAPIKVASWMGGDRDGNPNVTPAITLEVSMMSRWTAATLFKEDMVRLRSLLSFTSASDELRSATKGAREPYRFLLRHLEARLDATVEWAHAGVKGLPWIGSSNGEEPMKVTSELMGPLMVMYRSLLQTGMVDAASGELTNTIRRTAAFGLSLLTLDIRQESTRHTEALTAITRHLGLGSYEDWSEEERRAWLSKELATRRPLLPKRPLESLGFSPTVLDTLNTFKVASELPEGSLGAYVISQCQQASDVMAVVLLQQDADVRPLMRVAPLFETLADLQRAPSVTEALFSNTTYQSLIQGKQEIMVGYSDSAKVRHAGRADLPFAALFARFDLTSVPVLCRLLPVACCLLPVACCLSPPPRREGRRPPRGFLGPVQLASGHDRGA